ncbi:hypothetical protein Micbo1qcDRAFT_206430 [Microdochium bolleyi]|uniref:Secreted protein n=1 Tax=Microdochium bolleyi TaxID=196109 RepID=A0A136IX28_9PEZI|nr:hypothetical protein Micbo1qcDRAFT_206430 [Microdochium bolleyi]
MSPQHAISGLLTWAAAIATASAWGCYPAGGVLWTEIDRALGGPGVPAISKRICDGAARDYYKGEKRDGCFNVGNARVNWEVENISDGEAVLTEGECNDSVLYEMFGCNAGSQQNHGSFYYYLDPNMGNC